MGSGGMSTKRLRKKIASLPYKEGVHGHEGERST